MNRPIRRDRRCFMRSTFFGIVIAAASVHALAQQPMPIFGAQFEFISIKPNTSGSSANASRTRPDGSQVMTNVTISQIIGTVSSEPVTEVDGLPDWAMSERFDIVVKPPAAVVLTPQLRAQMMRNLLIARMNVTGHVEEAERTTFTIVLARSDGELGPHLRKSTLDCSPGSPATAMPRSFSEV